jgi:uncharacterized protein YdhG (YjbR/CyaY superfamily)
MATKQKAVKRTDAAAATLTDEEKAALKEHLQELKRAKRGATAADDERAVLDKIAGMAEPDRILGERFHALVKRVAPELTPRLWYGMPAYYKDGKNVCFFQDAAKFKARYATFGFDEAARLDDGNMWPTSYALLKLTDADEKRIGDLIRQAVS